MTESSLFSPRTAFPRLLDKATRLLAMRDHSEQELRRKLVAASAGVPKSGREDESEKTPEDIDKVIAWCYQHHWLDDGQFAKKFVISRSRKGYGPQRILQELQQKGIDRASSDTALATCEINWLALAQKVAERKFGSPLPGEWQTRAKVQRFLLYRGFFMEDIQDIYRNFAD